MISGNLQKALAASIFAACAWSGTLTSGTIQQNYSDSNGPTTFTSPITLTGTNFSITTTQPFSIFPNILSCGLGPSCGTYNFSQTTSFSGTNGFSNLTVVYNRVLYPNSISTPYSLALTLTFNSSSRTVPVTGTSPNLQVSFANVPFTATGSFTLSSGNTVIVTDTLSGQGLASGNSTASDRGSSGSIAYAFATPEPATFSLVGGGVLLAAWLARRRRT